MVEFDEHDPLPLAEQDLAVDHGDGDRGLTDEQLAHMRMAVDVLVLFEVLGPDAVIVVLVVLVFRNDGVDGSAEVVEEAGLRLVDDERGRCVRSRDGDLAMAY